MLTFWIPRPPDNANARGHSRVLNREKKKYWRELERRLHTNYFMPDPPPLPLARARIEATYHHINRNWMLDTDNAVRRLKPVVDFLVGWQFLVDDTPDHLEWTIPQQVIGVQTVPLLCSVRVVLIQQPPRHPRAPGEPEGL
jgi:hypothetical protein